MEEAKHLPKIIWLSYIGYFTFFFSKKKTFINIFLISILLYLLNKKHNQSM